MRRKTHTGREFRLFIQGKATLALEEWAVSPRTDGGKPIKKAGRNGTGGECRSAAEGPGFLGGLGGSPNKHGLGSHQLPFLNSHFQCSKVQKGPLKLFPRKTGHLGVKKSPFSLTNQPFIKTRLDPWVSIGQLT